MGNDRKIVNWQCFGKPKFFRPRPIYSRPIVIKQIPSCNLIKNVIIFENLYAEIALLRLMDKPSLKLESYILASLLKPLTIFTSTIAAKL